jgi:acyl-CoA dehydrogenase
MQFVLNELAGFPVISRLPGYEEATPDIVTAILNEAASMAGQVLAPLNKTGDETGCLLQDNRVIAPHGFAGAYRTFIESGWQGLAFDRERGGQGLPDILAAATNEMWISANLAFALCPMLTEGAIIALQAHADQAIVDRYLAKLIAGEWTGTMNLTEPQAGSDLAAVKTRAVPDGDHYLITGQKIFITWGDHDMSENIIHMVLARLPDAPPGTKGISLFLVPKYLVNPDGSTGQHNDVYPISLEHKLGIHGSPTCVMNYGDRGGAVGYLIGGPNNGITCMFTMMNHARLAVGMQGLGISERSYQQAAGYAKERVQGSLAGYQDRVTIIHHPDVRRMLMLMKAGTEAMRALCYVTAASLDFMQHAVNKTERLLHMERFALLTPVVKGWCTELAQELTSLGLQIHGGMGYIEETGAARHYRDARITTIYEGTTGIQARDLVDRKVLRDGGTAFRRLLAEMQEIIPVLKNSNDEQLLIVHKHFTNGMTHLDEAGKWLLANHNQDVHIAGAASFNFLMLMGTVCGGWQMARAALSAVKQLTSDPEDRAFYKSKLITARFYTEHILTRSHAYLQAVLIGCDSIMKLNVDQF